MNSTNSNNQIENPQPNVEELLRESKKQTKTASQKEPPTPEPLPQQPALPKASDTLQSKTAQQAQALVKADQKAAETRLQMGMKEGLKDAQDIEKGYQIGLLAGITKAKVKNTLELSEQLELLRQHTDNQIGESLSETLKQALEEADNQENNSLAPTEIQDLQPTEQTVNNPPKKKVNRRRIVLVIAGIIFTLWITTLLRSQRWSSKFIPSLTSSPVTEQSQPKQETTDQSISAESCQQEASGSGDNATRDYFLCMALTTAQKQDQALVQTVLPYLLC